jgi:hypothetical protein
MNEVGEMVLNTKGQWMVRVPEVAATATRSRAASSSEPHRVIARTGI